MAIMEYSLSKNPVSDLYKKADSYCLNTEGVTEGAEKVSGKEKFTQARREAALHKYEEAVANKYAGAIAKLKAGGHTIASVASEYGFNPEVFRNYLHKHELVLIKELGMTLNRYGRRVSHKSEEKYGEAIRLYETSDESLKSIAERLGLVYVSLGNYVRRNYPELIALHNERMADKKTNDKR